MAHITIQQTRVMKLKLPRSFDPESIQIGVPVVSDEASIVNLIEPGDVILPSAEFGSVCSRNAYGYKYPDRTQPKEDRYVTTNWVQPFGNPYASAVACDIYRPCYPQIEVPPTEIELTLVEKEDKQYVTAVLTPEIRADHLAEVVNLFLEIYGKCYIFSDEIEISESTRRRKCNWEILPPGEKPSVHLANALRQQGEETDTFDIDRLKTLDCYNVEQIVEGINGFSGYFAYVFSNYCVLESAIYGNATYVIPKENWESFSQKTKKELLDESVVIEKVVHTERWKGRIRRIIRTLENQ